MYLAILLNAKNDRNGNPRRVYVVYCDGHIVDAIDDNYSGWQGVLEFFPDAVSGGEFATTPAEYRDTIKRFSQRSYDVRAREKRRAASRKRFEKHLAKLRG